MENFENSIIINHSNKQENGIIGLKNYEILNDINSKDSSNKNKNKNSTINNKYIIINIFYYYKNFIYIYLYLLLFF